VGKGFVTGPGVVGTVGADRVEQLVVWNLSKQLRQHWRIANGVVGHLNGLDRQRLRIYAEVHLGPLTPIVGAVLFIFHSPSPSIFTPLLSTRRCNPSRLRRAVMATFSVF
jgi:hypothetical protein